LVVDLEDGHYQLGTGKGRDAKRYDLSVRAGRVVSASCGIVVTVDEAAEPVEE
jgi:hypothetical protein